MNGIINANKAGGCTSQSVVSKIRKALGEKTVGHMGTLDPQGEGVLLIGVGKAARLFDLFLSKDKVYVARFCFGYETDTLDKDGTLTATTQNIPTYEHICSVLDKFTGKIMQMPPRYSAKSVGGIRAYDLARRGVDFELSPASVEVYSISVSKTEDVNSFDFQIHCSSGTYIRSICRDIAHELSSLATMVSIKRTRCAGYRIEDALTVEQIAKMGEAAVIPVEDALKFLPRIDFDGSLYKKISCGVKFEYESIPGSFTVYCNDEFFGIGKIVDGSFVLSSYLRD